MSRFSTFLLGMVTGAALLHATLNYHVLRARDGFHLVAKPSPGLSDTIVDIRAFGVADWADHPQLAAALVQTNKQYLLGDSVAAAVQENIQQLVPAWPKQ